MGITDYKLVLIIVLANTLVALAVFIYGLFRARGRRCTVVMLSWLILLCPVAGIVFIFLGKAVSSFYKTREIDMNDVSFNKKREKVVLPPDSGMEMNFVPLEDAMAVSDTIRLRRLLIDILKHNNQETLTSIARAIDNSDTEVSHYAAAAIVDVLSDFRANLQNLLTEMNRYPDNVDVNMFILEYVYRMLRMNIMNDTEQRSTVYTENDIAENLYEHNLWYMKPEYYLWMTDLMISVKDFPLAEKWADRAWKYCSSHLSSYKARLHVYYAKKETEAFFNCISELKNSSIVVDKEILDLLRVYG